MMLKSCFYVEVYHYVIEFRLTFDFGEYKIYVVEFDLQDVFTIIRKNSGFRSLEIVQFKD